MVSAVPVGDGGAAGGSRSLSREPGISLALLQGTVELSEGAQTQEPWLGWSCTHSWGHDSVCALIAPISHGMEGKWLCSPIATSASSAEGSSG